MNRNWSKISLLFLFLIAVIGTLMRAFPYFNIPLQYDHLVHAHSHVAFQGWIYTLMVLLLPQLFLTNEQIQSGRYSLQFSLTIPVIVAILISFSLQGYGLYSIIFSTVFQFLNYWFIFRFLRDSRKIDHQKKSTESLKIIKTGLLLGLLSTLAPYAIGVLSAKGLSGTESYSAAVYFFLHFQYNGWFLFVAFGIFIRCLEIQQVQFDQKKLRAFLWLFALAVIPGYTLSLLGMSFRNAVLAPAILAALLQIVGLIIFLQIVKQADFTKFFVKNSWAKVLLLVVLISFVLKVCLQLFSIVPGIEHYAFSNRDLIIAYLHLSLIGVISFLLIAVLFHLEWIKTGWLSRLGSVLLICGFVVTETGLVLRGLGWGQSAVILVIFCFILDVGIFFHLFGSSKGSIGTYFN